jgi:hypothetical protein
MSSSSARIRVELTVMADFIFLQPSCDIHLVLGAGFTNGPRAMNNLRLTVFEGNFLAAAPNVTINRNVRISAVPPAAIACDFYPDGQTIVEYDAVSGNLRPLAVGEAFVQVRFDDPTHGPDMHHVIIARIQVHQTMNGWWFGNNSLTVFRDDTLHHGQVSLYALFDETTPGAGIVGDITGHGYVELTSLNTALFDVSTTYQDRIHGKAVGSDQLRGVITGPMLTQTHQLPIEVVDFTQTARRIIKGVDVQWTKPKIEQHNVLFLAEGFRTQDEELFKGLVTRLAHKLRNNARHSPYNYLKDNFNIWRAFIPSRENGVTMAPQVVAGGEAKGTALPVIAAFENSRSLQELTTLVGLPTRADATELVQTLRNRWSAPGSDAQLAGFVNANFSDAVIEAWKTIGSEGILQTRDSFYGLCYGTRAGERVSGLTNQLVTDPATADFARRIHTWFLPIVPAQNFDLDWRRYAPELRYVQIIGGPQPGPRAPSLGNLILDHMRTLEIDPSSPAIEPGLSLGALWQRDFTTSPTATRREISSVGLVCIVVNDAHRGAANLNIRTFAAISLADKLKTETTRVQPAPPGTRPINRDVDKDLPENPDPSQADFSGSINLSKPVDFLAHEFGHSFVLGDEYEDRSTRLATAEVEFSDNLTFRATVNVATPVGNVPRIDPERVKWLRLHRMLRSDAIVTAAQRLSSTQVEITLDPSRVSRWTTGEQVLLRKYKADTDVRRRQLPIVVADDLLELTINAINPTTGVITLDLTNPGASLPATIDFRAGSVLFISKRYRADAIVGPAVRLDDTRLKVTLAPTAVSRWSKGEKAFLHSATSNEILELFIAAAPDKTQNSITLTTVHFEVNLPASLDAFPAGSMLSENKKYKDDSEKFVVEKAVIDHMTNTREPLTNNFVAAGPDSCGEFEKGPNDPPGIDGLKKPCKGYRLIGVYEGGGGHVCNVYRPAGGCKMRAAEGEDEEGEFCFVCKYLIVNRVDSSKHEELDREYPKPKK